MRFGVVGRRLPVSASQVGAAAKCRLCGASTLVQCGRHKFCLLASAAVDNTHETFTVIHFQSNPSCAVQTICNGPSATHTASASTFLCCACMALFAWWAAGWECKRKHQQSHIHKKEGCAQTCLGTLDRKIYIDAATWISVERQRILALV